MALYQRKIGRMAQGYNAGTTPGADSDERARTQANVLYIVKRPALGGPSLLRLVEVARIELASGST